MEGKVITIHERWKQRTGVAFQWMFVGKSETERETLTQRENMALLISRKLAAFLLEACGVGSGGAADRGLLVVLPQVRPGGKARGSGGRGVA